MPRHLTEEEQALFEAVLRLETPEEAAAFFEDVCTVKEVQDMAQRLWVARLLSEGETYSRIRELTGASTATVSRVNRCLQYGAGGYGAVLKKAPGAQ